MSTAIRTLPAGTFIAVKIDGQIQVRSLKAETPFRPEQDAPRGQIGKLILRSGREISAAIQPRKPVQTELCRCLECGRLVRPLKARTDPSCPNCGSVDLDVA